MAVTKIADVIVPEVFVPYVIHRTLEKSNLVQSGIVVPDPAFNILAARGGTLIQMPFWNDLSGDDEVLTDQNPLTPGAISSGKDVAVLHMRGRAWGVNDLAKALSGDDPMAAIANLVATYWVRREQALLMAILKGVFATALASTHVKDASVADAANADEANLIGGSIVIDAATLLGDEADALTAMIMHSVPYSRLQKLNLIEWVAASQTSGTDTVPMKLEAGLKVEGGKILVPTFLGKRVIVDDGCPKASAGSGFKYTTYLFGPGAIARGEGNAPVPVETDRDSLAGEDYLIHRRHFLLHPRGVKYTQAAQVGEAPTNAECENGANWSRVYTPKSIRVVELLTNG